MRGPAIQSYSRIAISPKTRGRRDRAAITICEISTSFNPEKDIFLETAARHVGGRSPYVFNPKHAPMVRQMGFTWETAVIFDNSGVFHAIPSG